MKENATEKVNAAMETVQEDRQAAPSPLSTEEGLRARVAELEGEAEKLKSERALYESLYDSYKQEGQRSLKALRAIQAMIEIVLHEGTRD